MREVAIWSLMIVAGVALGIAVAGLNPPAKADPWQVVQGVSLLAVLTVFALALARFLLKNVSRGNADG